MDHVECQGELFTLPGGRLPPKLAAPPAAPKYAPYHGARTLCDQCVRDIHRYGAAVASFPAVARVRCQLPGGAVDLLCRRHVEERQAGCPAARG